MYGIADPIWSVDAELNGMAETKVLEVEDPFSELDATMTAISVILDKAAADDPWGNLWAKGAIVLRRDGEEFLSMDAKS